MFVRITNTPRDYAWGSSSAIAELLGTPASGGPEAELWLGAHPGSPARLVDRDGDLRSVAPQLPFLLKVLAADAPLSLQAHPTPDQARAGFERENAAGVPLDAPTRNYKDAFHKPELVVALSETFDALSGFRPVAETRAELTALPRQTALDDLLDRLRSDADLPAVVDHLITHGPGVDTLIAALSTAALDAEGTPADTPHLATVRDLAIAYPGDAGIAISMLLHRIRLRRGEALYLRAGNIHAYLHGLAIELMAASDNVLRGGLTPKHVDVPEFLAVLDFAPTREPRLEPELPAPGVRVFRPDVPDFLLIECDDGEYEHDLTGPAIALCTRGEVRIDGTRDGVTLRRSDAVYADHAEAVLRISGPGAVHLATTGA